MKLQFSAITEPENWLKMIAEQFGKAVINGELTIPSKYGEGVFKEFYPTKWLAISYLHFKMNEPIEMERCRRIVQQNICIIPIGMFAI